METMKKIFGILSGVLFSLSLFGLLHPASAGCLCKNYTKDAFCVEHIGACHTKAGNCIKSCTWTRPPDPAGDKKKKREMG
jgi:hypothetical protein